MCVINTYICRSLTSSPATQNYVYSRSNLRNLSSRNNPYIYASNITNCLQTKQGSSHWNSNYPTVMWEIARSVVILVLRWNKVEFQPILSLAPTLYFCGYSWTSDIMDLGLIFGPGLEVVCSGKGFLFVPWSHLQETTLFSKWTVQHCYTAWKWQAGKSYPPFKASKALKGVEGTPGSTLRAVS